MRTRGGRGRGGGGRGEGEREGGRGREREGGRGREREGEIHTEIFIDLILGAAVDSQCIHPLTKPLADLIIPVL